MILHGRVDYIVKADYAKGSEMEQAVFEVIDQAATTARAVARHIEHSDQARRKQP